MSISPISTFRTWKTCNLVLEILESRLTPARSWFEVSDLPLSIGGSTALVANVNVDTLLTVADIDLRLNLTHEQPAELTLTLVSPAGTEISLINQRGGTGTGFHDTIIDDQAHLSFNSTGTVAGERYRPEQSLAILNQEQAQGTWHLRIEDSNPAQNDGTLYSFWLGITSPPDDHGDTVATATPLIQGTNTQFSESGAIEDIGDHDWFSWTAPTDGTIQINLDASSNSLLDTVLTLRNASGDSLGTDDDSGPGINSQLIWQVAAAQVYYIDAKAYGNETGTYTIRLTMTQDDYGSTASSASPLPATAIDTWSTSGAIETAGDHDWFSWTAPTDGGIQINLDASTNSSLDPYLTLRNASGDSLSSDDDSGPGSSSQLRWQVAAGQTYYIDANAFGTGAGTYTVRLTMTPDDYGSTARSASPLPLTAIDTWSISGDIEFTRDHDWFSWTAPQSGQAIILMNSHNGGVLDACLTVFDANGNPLVSNDDYGDGIDSRIVMPVIGNTTYYIQASSIVATTGGYSITLDLSQPQIIATEINSISKSVLIAPDDVVVHQLAIPTAGHYLILAQPVAAKSARSDFASISLLLHLSNSTTGLQFVTDSAEPGNSDRDRFDRSGRWLEFDALTPGLFDLYVSGNGLWSGGYELSIHRETSWPGSAILASTITDAKIDIAGMIDQPGDRDRYTITNDTDQRIAISFALVASTESSLLPRIYRDDSRTDMSAEIAAGESLTIDATGLDLAGPSSTGSYILSIMKLSDDVPAGKEQSLSTGPFKGSFEGRSDRDAFTFQAADAGRYAISMMRRNSSVMYDCSVYTTSNHSGPSIAYLTEYQTSSTVDLEANQTIYIDARAYNSVGDYTISVTQSDQTDQLSDSIVDTKATQSSLELTSSMQASSFASAIESSGDKDWVKLTVPVSQSYQINLDKSVDSALDCYLTLRDSIGFVLASDDDSGPGLNSQLTINLIGGATYYAEARGYGSSTGKYTLTVAPSSQQSLDTIGDVTNPLLLSSDFVNSTKSKIDASFDSDAFEYVCTKNGTLTINLESTSGLDPILDILDSNKNSVASNDDYGLSLNSQVVLPVANNQKVYFLARGYGTSTGSYTLSWNLVPGSAPPAAAKDAPASFSSFGSGQNLDFTLTASKDGGISMKAAIDLGGDIDVYQWTPEEGGVVNLTLNALQGNLDTYVRVLDSQGKVLAFDDDSGPGLNSFIANFNVNSGSVYYVECKGYSSNSTGPYELTIQMDSGSIPDSFDPHQDEAPSQPGRQAPTIQFDGATGVVVGRIHEAMDGSYEDASISPFDIDTYRLDTTAAGGAVTVSIERETSFGFGTSQLDPALVVLDSTGQVSHRFAWQGNSQSPHSLTIPVAKNSTVYLQLAGQNGTVGGYRLSINRQVDDVVNGPAYGVPEQIPVDHPEGITRRIQYAGDTDYFTLRTAGTGRTRFTVTPLDENASSILVVTDTNGRELARSSQNFMELDTSIGSEVHAYVLGRGTSVFRYSISAISVAPIPNDEAGDSSLTARPLTSSSGDVPLRFTPVGPNERPPIFNSESDIDVWSFTAPATGKYYMDGGRGAITSSIVTRIYRQENGVMAGHFTAGDGQTLSGTFDAQAGETVILSLQGNAHASYLFSVSLAAANRLPVVGSNLMRQIGATLDESFSSQWLALQSAGSTISQANLTNHNVSQSLVRTLQSQAATQGIPFLIVWLDPVDFILVDGSGQSIGTREQSGTINGLTNANISSRGNLDLIVIANPQGTSFPMNLYGVGGGRVLGGAALVGSTGTVRLASIDYPDVSPTGLQLVLFGDSNPAPPPPPDNPNSGQIPNIEKAISAIQMPNGLDPTLVMTTYTVLLGSFLTAVKPMFELVASNPDSPSNAEVTTMAPWWFNDAHSTNNDSEWPVQIILRLRMCLSPIVASISHMVQPILVVPAVRDSSDIVLNAVQPALHAATSTAEAIDSIMADLPFIRQMQMRSGWKMPRMLPATSPTTMNPEPLQAPAVHPGAMAVVAGWGFLTRKSRTKKNRGAKPRWRHLPPHSLS